MERESEKVKVIKVNSQNRYVEWGQRAEFPP